ncbi:LuxR C-terminal-related transcriptional regulator [Kitasatospora sp. NPDC101183]|uniref:helix-turn-helix transcriptional regulator n=1 Tax=Kitasatospora sp. NPDC101183 TaxID=3364100 RepID=UPI0037F32F12
MAEHSPRSDAPASALPDAPARALYRQILRDGGRIRIADVPPEDAAAVQSLLDVGLLKPYVLDGSLSAVNPRSVTARIGADLRAAGTRLLRQAEELPDLLGDLTSAYDSAPRAHDRTAGPVRIVEGAANIRHGVSQLSEELLHEALSLQPGGARPADAADDILAHAGRFLGLGGSIRTIYETGARLDPGTVQLAARLTGIGCHLRVAPFAVPKMLVFDRTVAVVPAGADAAAFIEDPSTVAFLAEVFESYWRLAEGVNWSALAESPTDPAAPEQVGRLLAQGLTQRAIASRLGQSERTVAAHIARLREQYDADTLFQLGWQMRGVHHG